MRSGTVGRCWGEIVAGLIAAWCMLGDGALASTTPPHEYYVLSPEPLNGPISVMSLEPDNTITVGSYQIKLQQYETATIPYRSRQQQVLRYRGP